jgi:hypothetical protein
MLKWTCRLLLLFLTICSCTLAQQPLAGRVVKKGSSEILIGVTIANLSQGRHNVSDMGGNYKIAAKAGDTLLFSSAGYQTDTIIVAGYMFAESFLVPLEPHVVALQAVKVDELRNYQLDSIKRREEYSFILDKKHPVKLWNEKRSADGPGLSFSPIGYFSKRERQKRELKKRLRQEEEDYYIDSKFSLARVSQLTRLSGDSLRVFMWRYRPTYKFCRGAGSQDMLFYINEKLKIYKQTDKVTPRPKRTGDASFPDR